MTPIAVHHVQDGPAGAPVVLLSPSLGSTVAMWEPQVAALSRRFRVVRHDHRGHGGSPVPDGPSSIDDIGGDLVALLDALGVERAHVAGVSLGGMAAQWLAIHHPERVDRLALISTSARLGPPETWRERIATVRAEGTGALAPSVVERWFTPGHRAAHPDLVRAFEAMVAATPAEGYASCCAAIEHMDLEADLGAIRAPTLLVAGAEDPSTPPEHLERIAAAVPGARLEVLSPGAHLCNVERADEVDRLLLAHFGEA